MQVSVESTGVLERRMTVQLPAAQIQQEVDKRLQKYAKQVRLDGFRPGKAPLKIVRKRFGEQIYHETAGEMVEKTYYEALEEQGLQAVGLPEIKIGADADADADADAAEGVSAASAETKEDEAGQARETEALETPQKTAVHSTNAVVVAEPRDAADFRYVATFEVMPEIPVIERADLAYEKVVSLPITEAEVDAAIESARKDHRTWREVERPAQEGDQITLDYAAHDATDGKPVEQVGGKDYETMLGKVDSVLGDDLMNALAGITSGEQRTFETRYNDDYWNQYLQGKAIRYEVTCKKVHEAVYPDVDEAFAERFDIKEGGVPALREQFRVNMQRQYEDRIETLNREAVMNVLDQAHDVQAPRAMVMEEVKQIMEDRKRRFGFTFPEGLFWDDAARRVRLGLIVREIVERHDLSADSERTDARLVRMAEDYEDPQVLINMYRSEPELLQRIENVQLEQQLVEWIGEEAQVTEVSKTYSDVVNPPHPSDADTADEPANAAAPDADANESSADEATDAQAASSDAAPTA